MFITKKLPMKFLDHFSDNLGNILAMLVEVEGKRILIEGIYGPNRAALEFYSYEALIRLSNWI